VALDLPGASRIDSVALSLSCEFATEAVLRRPAVVRSVALISPTGVERRRADEQYSSRTREVRPMRGLLRDTPSARFSTSC
jgi:pimeloyl-ACP methyl ester carboxylesterase